MEMNENGFKEVSRVVKDKDNKIVETIKYENESIVVASDEATAKEFLQDKYLPTKPHKVSDGSFRNFNAIKNAMKDERISFKENGIVSFTTKQGVVNDKKVVQFKRITLKNIKDSNSEYSKIDRYSETELRNI